MDLFSGLWDRPLTATVAVAFLALILQLVYRGYRQRVFFRDLVNSAQLATQNPSFGLAR